MEEVGKAYLLVRKSEVLQCGWAESRWVYLMGLPRISAMMALSPPRYWKHKVRKL